MLQTQTVDRDTLGLLKDLMATPELQQFALVGGTNLSLRLGHRLSVDLDLFTNEPLILRGFNLFVPFKEVEYNNTKS